MKKLSEMTLTELWELFPIFLTEHKTFWNDYYNEMKNSLNDLLSKLNIIKISHIGSTAIKDIWAKPIIDILVEISPKEDVKKVATVLQKNGFIIMHEENNRISLNYGYTEQGFAEKVFHIHLRYLGDNKELYFRDYMNEFPKIAKEYERLKLKLWKEFEHDRDGYTNAKTDFIKHYTLLAKKYYNNKYN